MSGSRSVENPSVTIDNSADVARKIPSTVIADMVATSKDAGVRIGSPVVERITGPAANATVTLQRPISKVVAIKSFVTATGADSAKPNLTETTDFTVTKKDATTGKGTLKEALGTNYSAATWIVFYQADEAEGTIGGQSKNQGNLSGASQ
jgi:hypothetical protein